MEIAVGDMATWRNWTREGYVTHKVLDRYTRLTLFAGSRSYCCAWIHYPGYHASGSAWCGGGGYHKDSAAMQEALSLAGIQFAVDFAGVGENGETAALQALARWLDVPRYTIIKAHG